MLGTDLPYDFRSLLPADFEDLARDLAGKHVGCRFEAFGPGPDDGIDGRHSAAAGTVILQAKHYVDSTFPVLRTAMRRERPSIDRLAAHRYVLATSRSLTPANKTTLAGEIGPSLRNNRDILGPGDLNALLRANKDIERAHLKLWLSSTTVLTAVLDGVVHSASHAFTATTRQEIAGKVRVYAQNPSLPAARDILDRRHVLIVSGPPGVGKTTLAEILAFAYLGEGWELIAIRSLDDGFARIDDSRRQIFFFDDFLGSIALDRRSLSTNDTALALFMNRIRRSPNARFVLTTRAYILNEASGMSDRLADERVGLSTYVLDLSSYTRAIRARILYNHLVVGDVPREHVLALIDGGQLAKIVDHPNYNPRVVEWMTDVMRIEDVASEDYASAFLAALENPRQLWENAFRDHVTPACRHLLLVLFFDPGFGARVSNLRDTFEALHARLCTSFGLQRDPEDFERSLRHLEGGFVSIENGIVDFINPSLRDFLSSYLSDGVMLPALAASVSTGSEAREVWGFASGRSLPSERQRETALAFAHLLERFGDSALTASMHGRAIGTELYLSDRIDLLVKWWLSSSDARFIETAMAIARSPQGRFTVWRDGPLLLRLLSRLRDPEQFEQVNDVRELSDRLETIVIEFFRDGMATDDLVTMSDLIESDGEASDALEEAMRAAIIAEFQGVGDVCRNYESESELDDHASALRRLAPSAHIAESTLRSALETVDARIEDVRSEQTDSAEPSVLAASKPESDRFDDGALAALFGSLR